MTDFYDYNFVCDVCYEDLEYSIVDETIYFKRCKCSNERIDELESEIYSLEEEISEMDEYMTDLKTEIEVLSETVYDENENLKNQILDNCETNLEKIQKQYEFMFNE